MPLHVPVKVRDGLAYELIVARVAKVPAPAAPEPPPGPSHDDAPVRAGDQVVKVAHAPAEPDPVRVDQMRRAPALGALDVAARAPDGHDAARVLGQDGLGVRVGRVDDLGGPDGPARRAHRVSPRGVARRRDGRHGRVGLRVDEAPGQELAQELVDHLERPQVCGREAECALRALHAGDLTTCRHVN